VKPFLAEQITGFLREAENAQPKRVLADAMMRTKSSMRRKENNDSRPRRVASRSGGWRREDCAGDDYSSRGLSGLIDTTSVRATQVGEESRLHLYRWL
jgi:hypothetical protein